VNAAALPLTGMMLGAPAMLLLGLSSSPHCALMCAPLTQFGAARGRAASDTLMLHLGRLTAYAILGALAGGIGGAMLMLLERYGIGGIVRWIAAGSLLLLGAVQWHAARPRPACCAPTVPLNRLHLPAFARGLMWGLLPCPLLWAVLGLVTLSGNALQAALLTLAFGLGTSPLLLAITGIGSRIAGKIPERHGRRSAAVMMALGGLWIAATTPLAARTIAGFCFAGS
jgi:sulfite exporter TauE/SafE